jgi:aspartyl aminopeptidase
MIALFDNEEVGSTSTMGAGGPVMMDSIKRITEVLSATTAGPAQAALPHEAHVRALQKSFMVSADMAHALHPNCESVLGQLCCRKAVCNTFDDDIASGRRPRET